MNSYASCPQCKSSTAERTKFTWWGGVLGPKLLTHVKCGTCGKKYNGKSGKENTTGIVYYSVVVFGFCLAIMFVLAAVAILVALK